MRPLAEFPKKGRAAIRYLLTDVDDTLTDGPRLSAAAYRAMEQLADAGIRVVPVTAAPAGWCDLMARMWPIAAVIGENGGLCFRHDAGAGKTERYYWLPEDEHWKAQRDLAALSGEIVAAVPGCEIAHDQHYRETTLAFRRPKDAAQGEAILARMRAAGLRTTVNSLWVLGWFGDFDKLAMARRMMAGLFAADIDRDAAAFVYVGDSLNDEPMFGHFPHSVGVATVRGYLDRLASPPKWVTKGGGGAGFVEVAEMLLAPV
jgi:HAD superfamily hydrolase (TIGR01484 family)